MSGLSGACCNVQAFLHALTCSNKHFSLSELSWQSTLEVRKSSRAHPPTLDAYRRYWSDPAVLGKLSAVMGDTFDPTAMAAAAGAAGEGEEEEGEQEEIEDVHSAASAGLQAFALLHVKWKHALISTGCNVRLFWRKRVLSEPSMQPVVCHSSGQCNTHITQMTGSGPVTVLCLCLAAKPLSCGYLHRVCTLTIGDDV